MVKLKDILSMVSDKTLINVTEMTENGNKRFVFPQTHPVRKNVIFHHFADLLERESKDVDAVNSTVMVCLV